MRAPRCQRPRGLKFECRRPPADAQKGELPPLTCADPKPAARIAVRYILDLSKIDAATALRRAAAWRRSRCTTRRFGPMMSAPNPGAIDGRIGDRKQKLLFVVAAALGA